MLAGLVRIRHFRLILDSGGGAKSVDYGFRVAIGVADKFGGAAKLVRGLRDVKVSVIGQRDFSAQRVGYAGGELAAVLVDIRILGPVTKSVCYHRLRRGVIVVMLKPAHAAFGLGGQHAAGGVVRVALLGQRAVLHGGDHAAGIIGEALPGPVRRGHLRGVAGGVVGKSGLAALLVGDGNRPALGIALEREIAAVHICYACQAVGAVGVGEPAAVGGV